MSIRYMKHRTEKENKKLYIISCLRAINTWRYVLFFETIKRVIYIYKFFSTRFKIWPHIWVILIFFSTYIFHYHFSCLFPFSLGKVISLYSLTRLNCSWIVWIFYFSDSESNSVTKYLLRKMDYCWHWELSSYGRRCRRSSIFFPICWVVSWFIEIDCLHLLVWIAGDFYFSENESNSVHKSHDISLRENNLFLPLKNSQRPICHIFFLFSE